MVVQKKLIMVFLFFYLAVIVYLALFFFVEDFQLAMIESRNNLSRITEGSNYFWAVLISLGICFLGSASIGFPVPFPFVLFSLSNSIYLKYLNRGLLLQNVVQSGSFWLEIFGLAIAGGLGCALGEFSGYFVGYGAKKLANGTNSDIIKNIDGFGRLILENEKRTPLYVFLFALTPLPDDILFLPLGMIKYPFWKCILPGWLGKSFTTILYCMWPILISLGYLATGVEPDVTSSIITESIIMLATLTVMFFVMSFDWNKYLENRKIKRSLIP